MRTIRKLAYDTTSIELFGNSFHRNNDFNMMNVAFTSKKTVYMVGG